MDKKACLLGTLHLCRISQGYIRLYKYSATQKLQLQQSVPCRFHPAVPWSVVTTFSRFQGDSTANLWTQVKSPCWTDTSSWQYNQSSLRLLVNHRHVSWTKPMIPPGKQVMCIHNSVALRGVNPGVACLAVQPNPGNFRESLIPDWGWWGAEPPGAFTSTKLWGKLWATETGSTGFWWTCMVCMYKDWHGTDKEDERWVLWQGLWIRGNFKSAPGSKQGWWGPPHQVVSEERAQGRAWDSTAPTAHSTYTGAVCSGRSMHFVIRVGWWHRTLSA